MLATFFECWWHLLDVPDPKLYENMDVVDQNGQNRRQHSYHQHILSSTSVTNIDMTSSKYNIIYTLSIRYNIIYNGCKRGIQTVIIESIN